jgi:hypothetical protein
MYLDEKAAICQPFTSSSDDGKTICGFWHLGFKGSLNSESNKNSYLVKLCKQVSHIHEDSIYRGRGKVNFMHKGTDNGTSRQLNF